MDFVSDQLVDGRRIRALTIVDVFSREALAIEVGRLNVHWFESLEEAKARIDAWRRDYNESRPHQALREQTPAEFAARAKELEGSMSLRTAGN